MADTIDINIINDLKQGAGKMQESINSSSLTKEAKDINTAKLKEALNILDKGANATAKDLNRVSGILRSVTQTLVKAYAGTEKVVKGLSELQDKLQKAISAREKARDTQKDLRKHKIQVNDETGEVRIRKAEVGRMLKDASVKNTRGENYTSVDAVYKAAEAGNKAAVDFLNTVKQRLDELKSEYSAAKTAESKADVEVKSTTKQIDELKTSPEGSVAVQMQEFGNELQNLIDKLKSLNADKADAPTAVDSAVEEGSLSAEDINKATKAQEKQNSSLGRAFKQFTIYAIALRTVKKALREAVTTITELDKYLTEQAMVMGKTRQQTYALLKQYQALASQLGATTKEVAQVAGEFMRQGKTTEDALTLTTAAVSAAKVASISVSESVDYLTTALNGFQLSAENAMIVSDKFASIAALSATSFEEIATALSKVAAQANLAGMSIDYTTALLAKGIETTREAPETIGTALKTIIARMRELSDYGETLSGDTDINNVESQLAYVGIALRDANGELRSTEDVLDELGKKWADLNSNQQAAIAKALAGTRQQSRLIAMMNDYERVTELQTIAQRSQGATMAQMAVYGEGMEAALNRLNVSWEKIVTSITNSEVIIKLIQTASDLLNKLNSLLQNDFILFTSIAAISVTLLGSLLQRYETQKAINRATLEKKKADLDTIIIKKREEVEQLKVLLNSQKTTAAEKEKLKDILRQNMALAEQHKDVAAVLKYQTLISKVTAEGTFAEGERAALEQELRESKTELLGLEVEQKETSIALLQNGVGFVSVLGSILSIITPILAIYNLIVLAQKTLNTLKAKSIVLTEAQNAAERKGLAIKAKSMFASVIQAFAKSPITFAVGLALAAGLVAGLGLIIKSGISAYKTHKENTTAEGAAKKINSLSNEIYTLNKQAEALDTTVRKFDELDKKVLKTNKDLKEMSELLNNAADNLREESVKDNEDIGYGKGVNQKEYYNSLITDEDRRKFLETEAKKDREKANEARREQLQRFNNLTGKEFTKLATGTDADSLAARNAIYAMNNNAIYDYVDSLNSENDSVEMLTQSLLEQVNIYDALDYANNPQKIHKLVDSLVDLKTIVDDSNASLRKQVYLTDVLTSDSYSIKDKTEAYREAQVALQGDTDALAAFNQVYNEYKIFDQLGDDVLDLIDTLGLSADKINELASAYKNLNEVGINVGKDYWKEVIETYSLTGKDLEATIDSVFGSYLNALGQGTEEYKRAYNAVVKVMENLLTDSILNIGQNIDKLKGSVSSVYETANKWNSMSDTDKTQFLIDNADLFAGTDGENLLKAFESGNYAAIQAALQSNSTLNKMLDRELQAIEERLKVEEARKGDEYNASLVQYLKEQKQLLENRTQIYQASLEDRLKLEQSQLDIYKDYLQKQQDALKDSLEKRKDAYQKYFDAINQESEDEDYEEKVNLLVANLSRLSASDDAASKSQTKELEKQLADLEEERLDTLRERAQEQVLSNIDDEINQITEKFDKLLETDNEILKALQGEINNGSDIMTKMLTNGLNGKTLLEAQDYLENTFKPAFGSVADLSNVQIEQNTSGDLILNVAGRQINLTQSDSDDLSSLIYAALSRLGISTI